MLLRRITKHVKAQNWFAVALDFLIVVVGVFIGIQVANWNAARGARIAEAQYLTSLKNDAVFSIESIEAMIGRLNEQQAARQKLYIYNRSPDQDLADEEIDGLIQASLFNLQRDNISQIAFDALSGSGQLSIIGDPELVTALQRLDAAAKQIKHWQDESLQFTYSYTDPYLIENADMGNIIVAELITDNNYLEWVERRPEPSISRDALKSVKFKNYILYRAEITRGRIAANAAFIEQSNDVIAKIETRQAEIGGR